MNRREEERIPSVISWDSPSDSTAPLCAQLDLAEARRSSCPTLVIVDVLHFELAVAMNSPFAAARTVRCSARELGSYLELQAHRVYKG